MLVLITGLGNVGKSSFRRHLAKTLHAQRHKVVQVDVDGYSRERNPADTYLADPRYIDPADVDTIWLIEDIHAFGSKALMQLDEYNLIFYVHAPALTHLRFWVSRGLHWMSRGVYDWQPDRGFRGTRKSWDLKNVPGVYRVIRRAWGQRHLEEGDYTQLGHARTRVVIVEATYTKKGPVFYESFLEYFPETLAHT